MRTAARRMQIARVSALTVALIVAIGACRDGGAQIPAPEGYVEIRGKQIAVEIADSRAEQEKGLGERDSLEWGKGMYFSYARPGFFGFWMKGMRFSIDIVFLREGRIVELYPQVPFEKNGNGPTIRPRSLVDGVLEVPAGFAAANGWQVGDRLSLERVSGG